MFRNVNFAYIDQSAVAKKLLGVFAITAAVLPAIAQDTSTYKEQGKLIRAPEAVTRLGAVLFGDKVNLYTGSLEFVQTDVSLPGNSGLPVSVGRRLITGQQGVSSSLFGRWDLEIPHLHGVFASSTGWATGLGTNKGARCTAFGAPPAVNGSFGSLSTWAGTEYWHGSFLYIPGQGDQEMLRRANYSQAPGDNPTLYPIVTRSNWAIRCLPAMSSSNGGSGEAFVAVSPDGTEYQFDWLVSRSLPMLTKSNSGPELLSAPVPGGPSALSMATTAPSATAATGPAVGGVVQPTSIQGNALTRTEVWVLPTRISDRVGNTVTYTYDTTNKWQLKTIVATEAGSSPRTITLNYATPGSLSSYLVTSVTDGTRTWKYSYSETGPSGFLQTVTLPDNSTWQLGNILPLLEDIDYLGEGGCDTPGNLNVRSLTGSMVHPAGATGEFTLAATSHGRAGVENKCNYDPAYNTYSAVYPKVFDTYALTNKSLSGPGIPTLTWVTSYPPEASSWAPCNSCNASKQVEVTDPAGHKTRHTFGTLFRETEGQLQQTDVIDKNGTAFRSTYLRYAEPVTPFGESDQRRGDGQMAARVLETNQRKTTLQGVDFVWEATAFNNLAQPTQVTRWSTLGATRSETTAYKSYSPTKWILGQVESVTETVSGKVMVFNDYDAATANLKSVAKFGHLEQSMSYNADGTLATRKDGRNQTTTFSNYKRGLAQNVRFHDGTAESATVNDIGLVTSVTRQIGASASATTNYGYDAMGRLASIAHPTADGVAWNPTTISFGQMTVPEFDLAAGHWRQIVVTGTAAEVNYFDALWQPIWTERWDDADRTNTIRTVKHQYDFAGRTSYESYPKRNWGEIGDGVYHEFDALGRPTVTSTISENGTLYSGFNYGRSGFEKTYTDAKGNNTYYRYQAFDEPSEGAISGITAPEGVNVDIRRDVFGKPQAITRSGGGLGATRGYVYDANERLCKTIEPETGATVQDYDAANNVSWRASGLALPSTTSCDTGSVLAAKKIVYGYDTLNRLTSTTYGDASPAITRTYTADGLPETISSNGAVWTSTYNKRRLNDTETLAYGGATYRIGRAFDANGSLSQLTYPDNTTLAYNPNALGEPRQAGVYASAVSYHPNGAIKSFTYGNGIAHSMSQNQRGLPEWSEDAGILKDNYTYDQNANVSSILDWREGVSNRTMEYDGLDRLKRVNAPAMWADAIYTYDALDNLRSTLVSGGGMARNTVHDIDPVTNRLRGIDNSAGTAYDLSYSYDAQGNITQRGTQGYTFDLGNRMKSATGKATYAYDGLGHRVSVVGADGVNRIQVYSQGGQLLYVKPTNASTGTNYVYLHNHVLAEVSAAGVTYDHTDGLGSPVARTNGAAAILNRTRYEPYGAVMAGTAGSIGFTGHVNDIDTGLVYMQQRYYDPIAGRMLSIDPVTTDANTGGSFNRYAYANNNPYSYIDPDGRDTYRVNRDLRVFGSEARSINNPISHTLVATTDKNGNIAHTYSWGNDANLKGWNIDQPLDISTASEAIKGDLAEKVGGSKLDPFIAKEFNNLNKKENEHSNLIVTDNCKTEATKLINGAKQQMEEPNKPPEPQKPDPLRPSERPGRE